MAKSVIKNGIGYSPLSEKVYLGKQNKTKNQWVGEKVDITNDFIDVMMAFVPENTTRKITGVTSKNVNIFININKKDKVGIEKAIKFLQKQL